MTLNSLDSLLKNLMSQQAWQHQRRLKAIADFWSTQLPKKAQQYSRPHSLKDNILFVATANSTWSQHLTLQRLTILTKLNAQLTTDIPIKDIRFSTVHWQSEPAYSPLADPDSPHPSHIGDRPSLTPVPRPHDQSPTDAVRAWLTHHHHQLKEQPLCPECQAPTPQGELTRWQMCRCCIAQQWYQQNNLANDQSP